MRLTPNNDSNYCSFFIVIAYIYRIFILILLIKNRSFRPVFLFWGVIVLLNTVPVFYAWSIAAAAVAVLVLPLLFLLPPFWLLPFLF